MEIESNRSEDMGEELESEENKREKYNIIHSIDGGGGRCFFSFLIKLEFKITD